MRKAARSSQIPATSHTINGKIQMKRVGRFRFPVEELTADGDLVAQLGRDGSLRIFFGPGRRIRLADGTMWRIKATTRGRHITPIIVSPAGKVAISGPLFAKRSYGINLKDRGYSLIPLGRTGLRRQRRWALRRHEQDIATIDDATRTVTTTEPVPAAAILMAFTLMTHGIPGEGSLMPKRD
jgi:hypothetical protein